MGARILIWGCRAAYCVEQPNSTTQLTNPKVEVSVGGGFSEITGGNIEQPEKIPTMNIVSGHGQGAHNGHEPS